MIQAPERVVPDASLAAKWHLSDEQHSDQAVRVLTAYVTGDLALVAPEHFRFEVPAAIRAATRRKPPRLSREQGEQAVAEFLRFAIPTVSDDALVTAAYVATYAHGCGFYDGPYLALAQRLDVPLVTADNRFYQHVRHLQR